MDIDTDTKVVETPLITVVLSKKQHRFERNATWVSPKIFSHH